MKIISSAEDVDLDRQRGGADWEKRLEIQANLFASYLLIPENPMINKYFEVKRELGYSDRQRLYLDNQPVNIEDCNIVFNELSRFFNVSKQMVKIRLLDDNLLVENNSI
jgi:Zn-dependent peptidase ImmA (M78 family)